MLQFPEVDKAAQCSYNPPLRRRTRIVEGTSPATPASLSLSSTRTLDAFLQRGFRVNILGEQSDLARLQHCRNERRKLRGEKVAAFEAHFSVAAGPSPATSALADRDPSPSEREATNWRCTCVARMHEPQVESNK
ncbi:hypothetical protein MRX96_043030 [Rhipicephalus microplus]